MFKVTEFERNTMKPTGVTEQYSAEDIHEAARNVLYTKKLVNDKAFIGPSGRTVFCGSFCYAITEIVSVKQYLAEEYSEARQRGEYEGF